MDPHRQNQRRARRFELELAALVDGEAALTRNLSSSGVYLLMGRRVDVGAEVSVEVFFPRMTGASSHLTGKGRVVRTEPEGMQVGVGIMLDQMWMPANRD